MRQLPFNIEEGDKVYGRFGRHTNGTSPDWNSWKEYTVNYTQYDNKKNLVIIDIGGVEFCPLQYEGTVDDQDKIHCFNVEEIIFEFELLN